ncbi:5'-nucleotidase C-terminal domain-containing protein [Crocosphaera sp.]|uniref:5'-nucleotidase C-terminal domain-containing protein n=1 Tax=Crocosphaera sp. TaxID=2729996 RepID=UPI0026092CBB|nr:5'-nucleotidase C-terminal domain-containing protein [Crocosphaera sp.]MDJ0579175.1 5'-nucleotidase C-terminal domain-containing protein [Crocosphaera sp.]
MVATDIFISEYIEGTSFNKALELFNSTGGVIDLLASNYTLELYSNGRSYPIVSHTFDPGTRNAGITITGTPQVLEQGETTDTYTIALDTTPTGTVQVQVAAADGQTRLSIDGINFSNLLTLSLTDTNATTVTVQAVDDNVAETLLHAGNITHSIVSSGDPNYSQSLTPIADQTVDIMDNDTTPTLIHDIQGTVDPYRSSDHDPIIVGLDLDSNTTNEPFTLQLFHAADQEAGITALDDAPRFSAVLNALRNQDIDNDGEAGFENTLTLSSGDAFISGLFFDASQEVFGGQGRGDILIQNELGFQAIAIGNHEFDDGTGTLRNLILPDTEGYEGTQFPYLSANIDFSGEDNLDDLVVANGQEASSIPNSIAENTIITLDSGERIGVVGAVTPTLPIITTSGNSTVSPSLPWDPNNDADLNALAAEIQTSVDALLADNSDIDKVILLAHMQQIEVELALAERLSDVDIIVAGGSNTRLFDSNDRPRAGDEQQGDYPIFSTDVDGNPVAVVNTDGNYRYVGRLVIDFDSNGHIIENSYDPNVSGAYATDEQGVEDVGGTGLEDPEIVEITNQLREVIVAQESNVFGVSRQFLNGNRSGGETDGVRNQETNLGNLTADANLAIAQQSDASTVISFRNGGGIRASIGRTVVPTGSTGDVVRTVTEAVPDANKPEGGISQADIANTLAFNNGLTLVTVTAQELLDILEHGVSDSTNNPTSSQGRFPQVGGLSFSFDLTQPNDSRIQSLAIKDENGVTTDVVVENGALVGDPNRTFRMVTLGFLANGGDGYNIPQTDRVDLSDSANEIFTGEATFAPDGTEQDALAEYLKDNFFDTPYTEKDVTREFDTRIQNLNFRSDTALLSNITGTAGRDSLTGTAFDDVITGLQGRDTITTLAGNDRIVYTQIGDRSDTITDFEVGSDVIDLSQLLDSVGYTGTDAIADGYLGFRSRGSSNSIITFDSDGSGGPGRASSYILVQGVSVVDINNSSNFVF